MYRKLSTRYYDLDKPRPPRDGLDFYLRRAAENPMPILEPMCGSGRFLLPILEAGYAIEGVDSSPDMLRACRQRAAARGLNPNLYAQRIEELDLPKCYGLVFIPSGSINLIPDDETIDAALQSIHAHLYPGGLFILELLDRSTLPGDPETTWSDTVKTGDGSMIEMSGHLAHYDRRRGIARSVITYCLKKRNRLQQVETEDFILRYHDTDAFCDRLTRCGFAEPQLQVGYHDAHAPPTAEQPTIIMARKPTRTR